MKMRAVVKSSPEVGVNLEEVDVPTPGHSEVLVRVKVSTICGTDLHIYKWDTSIQHRIKLPRIIGHEMSGEVVETGKNVRAVKPGDFVSAETHFFCGTCFQCRNGQPHLCQNLRILGVDTEGSFAEYVLIPEKNTWKNSPSLSPEWASLQEPMGNAVYATLEESVEDKVVAVFGGGPIGLMACAVAKASRAKKVFLSEPNDFRRNLGLQMGADVGLNPLKEDIVQRILEETNGIGADVALEMSGHPQAFHHAFQSVRSGGRVSLLGLPAQPISLNWNEEVILKGVTVYGIHGRKIWQTWHQVQELLESGKVNLDPLISARFPLEKAPEALELMSHQQVAKIALIP
ncbi:MAG: L-threonine 3-dehydrogenase [bacterium JZ-2024 1]